ASFDTLCSSVPVARFSTAPALRSPRAALSKGHSPEPRIEARCLSGFSAQIPSVLVQDRLNSSTSPHAANRNLSRHFGRINMFCLASRRLAFEPLAQSAKHGNRTERQE